jgi:membrane associated rhomboid family serine protease
MSAAPVGFHCPECIAEGRRSVRPARTVLGGEVHARDNVITKALIGINVAVWLIGLIIGNGSLSQQLFAASHGVINWNEITARFGLVLGNSQDPFQIGVADGDWYRLITVAFVHEAFWHIGMNMFALWVLGSALEPVLGRWRFISLYLLAALGGSAASLAAATDYSISIGASGAVFGLMGALFIVMRKLGRETGAVVVILAINVVFGFVVQGIDWRAHLGGLVVGCALAAAFAYAPRQHRLVSGIAACVVVLVAVGVAVFLTVNGA